jgi:hypothetical protein
LAFCFDVSTLRIGSLYPFVLFVLSVVVRRRVRSF